MIRNRAFNAVWNGVLAAALLCALASCDEHHVRIGVPKGLGEGAGTDLVGQLLKTNISAHRQSCVDELECAGWLVAKEVDLAVLSASMAAQISTPQSEGPHVLAVTEAVEHSKVIAGDRQLRSLTELAAVTPPLRIAMSYSFAARAEGGFASLAQRYGLSAAIRIRNDSVRDRLEALDRGEVDAAVIDQSELPVTRKPLDDPHQVLEATHFAIVSSHSGFDDKVRAAAKASVARLAEEISRPTIQVAVHVPAVADELATQLGTSIEVLQRALPQHNFVVDSAVVNSAETENEATDLYFRFDDAKPSREQGLEAIVTFDSGAGHALTLFQRESVLKRRDAQTIMATSSLARFPSAGQPSIWNRAGSRVASKHSRWKDPWIDSLLNLAALLFSFWLVVSVFRRSNMPSG